MRTATVRPRVLELLRDRDPTGGRSAEGLLCGAVLALPRTPAVLCFITLSLRLAAEGAVAVVLARPAFVVTSRVVEAAAVGQRRRGE
jgi:hypothetical protein